MARASRWVLCGVLSVAAAVRAVGIGFGLPFPYAAVDERIVTDRVQGFLHGDLDPHYFAYPSLCFELHGLVGVAQFALGRVTGRWTSLAQFRESCWLDPGILLLPERWLTLLMGVATAWAASRAAAELARAGAAASRAVRRAAAVVGALAVATCLLHISNSRTITVDIPCVLFGALALAHALRHARAGRRRDLVMAALHAGLAGSSKYYGALFALPVAAAAVVAVTRADDGTAKQAGARGGAAIVKALALAGAVTLATFLLTSPFVLLDWSAFTRDFSFLQHHVEGGHYGHDPTGNGALVYGRILASELVGPALLAAALIGALLLFVARDGARGVGTTRARRGAGWVVLLQPLAHFALIASFKAQPPDYLLPLLPALAALAGLAIARGAQCVAATPRGRSVAAGLFALPLLIGGAHGLEEGLALRRPDSRVLLREWAARQWPDATRVASDSWLELPLTRACLEQIAADRAANSPLPQRRGGDWTDEQLAAVLAATRRAPPAVGVDFLLLLPRELDLGDALIDQLRSNGFRWLVLNGTHAARTERMHAQFPARAALYDKLSNGPWVVARFPSKADEGSGPELVVCDLDRFAKR